MPKLSEVLEAIGRNTPWSQHHPHDPELLAEFIEQLKADESEDKRPTGRPVSKGGKT